MRREINLKCIIIVLFVFAYLLYPANLVSFAANKDFNFTDVSSLIRLRNGMEVLLIPDRSVSQVASMIIVKSGHVREDEKTYGFSYLLKQLLFYGTESRTKEQLDLEIKGMGAYCTTSINADSTVYLMLAHSAYTNKILEIQSDILFNSKIQMASINRENEILKEKILTKTEESDFKMNKFFQSQLHKGTPYEHSILGDGYKNLARDYERLLEYYHTYYVPNNICAVIMGDIDSNEIERLLDYNFGQIPPSVVPNLNQISPAIDFKSERLYKIESSSNRKKILRVGFKGGINLDFRDITALALLKEALSGEGGLLKESFDKKNINIFSATADLSYNQFYGNFEIRIDFPKESNENEILAQIENLLPPICDKGISKEQLSKAKRVLANKEIFDREQIHHYLMKKALPIATLGPAYLLQYPILLDSISSSEIADVAAKYLSGNTYVAVLSKSLDDTDMKQKNEYKSIAKVYRQTKELPNGIKIIVEKKADSKVFAVNVLANNRFAQEFGGLEGIVEFTHRMLSKGAKSMNKSKIQDIVLDLGANLNTDSNNQYIPCESLNRDYSSICFETTQDKAEEGVNFLKNLIIDPLFQEKEIEDVRSQMNYLLSNKEKEPATIAEYLLFKQLIMEGVKGRSPYGTVETIAQINQDTLKKFHKDYFAPNNLIISAVSGLEPEDAISLIEKEFSEMKGASPSITLQRRPVNSVGNWVEKIFGLSKSYILYCIPLPNLGCEDRLTMTLVASLINSKLVKEEFLANNIKACVKFSPQISLFQVNLETTQEQVTEAVSEIKNKIKFMQVNEIPHEDLMSNINELVGQLSIKTLASINRASYLSFAHSIGDEHYFGQEYRQKLLAITSDQIKATINHYLDIDSDIVVVVR